MIRSIFVLLFAISILVLLSCSDGSKPTNVAVKVDNITPPSTPLPASSIDELASGRKIYEINCAICHKENGTGGEVVIEGKKLKPDDLTGAKIKGFSDDKIIGYIVNGVEDEGMPSFKDKLSEGEVRDVVKFIRSELQKMPAPASPKS